MLPARLVAILLVVIAAVTPASAQDDTTSPAELAKLVELATAAVDRFELFAECAPMRLLVENLPDDANDIDLTMARIQTLAESRLRSARLYDAGARTHLYVRVGVLVSDARLGGAYRVEVSFNKHLRDGMSERNGFAPTWTASSYGMHGGDAGFILQNLSERLDQFVLEYLRVNEAAC